MRQSGSGRNGGRGGRSGLREGSRTRETGRARQDEARKPRSAKPAAERQAQPAPRSRPPAEAPRQPTRAQAKAAAQEVLATGVQTLVVEPDEADMRVDRFLVARFPQLAFTHIQRIVRKGELRVDGRRAQPSDRLQPGQKVRVPPLKLEQPKLVARSAAREQSDRDFLKSITLYEDKDVLIINKPMGLAVQGGSGTTRHVDQLLESMKDAEGQRPRLVHRLDKDTAGCLVIAKTRFAASTMAKSFRSRTTRKIYWALVAGVPRVRQGRISTYLAKEGEEGDARMRVARHGEEGASHALTYYAVVDTAAQKLAWVSLKPVTGRTHQLRAHTAHIGHPIVGDPKYFDIENWELPGGIQNKLHLLARRIVIAHPRTGKPIDVTAPLPPHMQQSFNLLGFDAGRYDPIVDAPED
ncbi:RluA family pseudouridine synthase [Microvirga thermotolerans]|uniref:Ribosomal large subunit pseudouridine synthase D n=1 Tax=Microvirga thermotolerans TaxID=2651334 RepID=A0A5P9JXC7_9HYPH|nr:RluA family pseudouridine synthase [Microvirga thermotolerans]QFU16791.1 RluA family pseudouridine synthase [Microvirga thermotolerans]